ncbi:MAG: hypothetical protein QXI32_05475 [Candidatus Bathyarchaeia archaeon]
MLISTSRRPTRQIRKVCRDLRRVLGNTVYVNRGKHSLRKLIEEALLLGHDKLLLLNRWKGNPGKMELYDLVPVVRRRFPIIYLHSAICQRELGGKAADGAARSLVLDSANLEVIRLAEALEQFLEIPRRPPEVCVEGIYMVLEDISGHTALITFKRSPDCREIGPRLVIRNLVWSELGEEA